MSARRQPPSLPYTGLCIDKGLDVVTTTTPRGAHAQPHHHHHSDRSSSNGHNNSSSSGGLSIFRDLRQMRIEHDDDGGEAEEERHIDAPSWCEAARRRLSSLVNNNNNNNATTTIRPRTVEAEWIGQLKLDRLLGAGSFGAAFSCTTPEGETGWVVKVPASEVRDEVVAALNNNRRMAKKKKATRSVRAFLYSQAGRQPYVLKQCLIVAPDDERAARRKRERIVDDFREECANAEQILEPALFVQSHTTGRPPDELDLARYQALVRAVERHRSHCGYAHLHQIVHFEPSIPALLSERATGTLDELYAGMRAAARRNFSSSAAPAASAAPAEGLEYAVGSGIAPPYWTRLAAQVADAVHFLLHFTPLSHLDIKPANILYKGSADAPHCLLSDYGLCAPHGEEFHLGRRRQKVLADDGVTVLRELSVPYAPMNGTPMFNPPERERFVRWMDTGATAASQMCFNYATTMLSLVLLCDGVGAPCGLMDAVTAARPTVAECAMLPGSEGTFGDCLALSYLRGLLAERDPREMPDHFRRARLVLAATRSVQTEVEEEEEAAVWTPC